jgi:hypothetical protein
MQTNAIPHFEQFDLRDSCILETRFTVVGVYVVVEAYRPGASQSSHVEVFFPQHRGFILLDEGDMPSWLGAECFRTNHLVYNILNGGWFDGVISASGLLAIASAASREWLVITANECVSVFSDVEPLVRDISA